MKIPVKQKTGGGGGGGESEEMRMYAQLAQPYLVLSHCDTIEK